jgi:hypothetical protein
MRLVWCGGWVWAPLSLSLPHHLPLAGARTLVTITLVVILAALVTAAVVMAPSRVLQ